jgi:hypothetical protein
MVYSADIVRGRVVIEEAEGRRTKRKKKHTVRAPSPHLEAIAVELEGEEVTITWADGSASVHALPTGALIRTL